MALTASQGQALVTLLHQLRHDWDLPGIAAALRKSTDLGTATEIAVAACRLADNPAMRTPALIPAPGPHWQGLVAGTRPVPVMCPEHPARKAGGCPECVALAVPKPEGFVIPKPRKQHPPSKPQTADEEEAARLKAIREHIDAHTEHEQAS